jgi:hypothetical protein
VLVITIITLDNIDITLSLNHTVATATLDIIVEAVCLDHIIATAALDNTAEFGTILAFVISLVVLLTSSLVMGYKQHLWNFSVLQRVRLSNIAGMDFNYLKLML